MAAKKTAKAAAKAISFETVPVASLTPHPRNYRSHPEDQIAHLCASIEENGVYRPIVVAEDSVILAGHGVHLAIQRLEHKEVSVMRLPIDSSSVRALKILAADNEIAHLAINDDRALTEILKEVKELDVSGLLGTGYDEKMLAALLMVTRPATEIGSFDDAAQWVGMPEYENGSEALTLIVTFENEQDRLTFIEQTPSLRVTSHKLKTWSARWPFRENTDSSSVAFEEEEGLDEEEAYA